MKSSSSQLTQDNGEYICKDCSVPGQDQQHPLPTATRPEEDCYVVIDSNDEDSDCFIVEDDQRKAFREKDISEDSISDDEQS